MILKTYPFFEGVSIGIDEAGRPEEGTPHLSVGQFLEGRFENLYFDEAWSNYVRYKSIVRTERAQWEQTWEIPEAFPYRRLIATYSRSRQRFEAEGLLELLLGADSGIRFARPDISTRFDASNWSSIAYLYPGIRRRYLQHGIPGHALPELFTRNVVGFFLDSALSRPSVSAISDFASRSLPIGRLGLLSFFGFGERFGWLQIETNPTAARLAVDSIDWGTSPAGKGVKAGAHSVRASKGWLSAEQQAEVQAGKNCLVELELAALPRL